MGFLADTGYQGLYEFTRAALPKKKTQNGYLSRDEQARNHLVSSDQVTVQNFFGRLYGIWDIMTAKWRWVESGYDHHFNIYVVLTKLDVHMQPLRSDDLDTHLRIRNLLFDIGFYTAEKLRKVQQKYLYKRRARIDVQFRAT